MLTLATLDAPTLFGATDFVPENGEAVSNLSCSRAC
jgi:hypothetical protein